MDNKVTWYIGLILGISCLLISTAIMITTSELTLTENKTLDVSALIFFQVVVVGLFVTASRAKSKTLFLIATSMGVIGMTTIILNNTLSRAAYFSHNAAYSTAATQDMALLKQRLESLDAEKKSHQVYAENQSKSIYRDSRQRAEASLARMDKLNQEIESVRLEIGTLSRSSDSARQTYYDFIDQLLGVNAAHVQLIFWSIICIFFEIGAVYFLKIAAITPLYSIPAKKIVDSRRGAELNTDSSDELITEIPAPEEKFSLPVAQEKTEDVSEESMPTFGSPKKFTPASAAPTQEALPPPKMIPKLEIVKIDEAATYINELAEAAIRMAASGKFAITYRSVMKHFKIGRDKATKVMERIKIMEKTKRKSD